MSTSITANIDTLSPPGAPSSLSASVGRWLRRVAIMILVTLTLSLALLVAYGGLYRPGSTLGYNLGLVGSLMMLSLLLYPLRKRIPFLERLGTMRGWFKHHMILGIVGPVLVLFHSTFKPVSMNGRIAFYAMILVALSGVVGRFVYRQVHIGLYGRERTLADAEAELEASAESVNSAFALEPEILWRLKCFRDAQFVETDSALRRAWCFLTLRWRGRFLAFSTRRAVKQALEQHAKQNNWTRQQSQLGYQLARQQVVKYIDSVRKAATYSTWQRIFSLWHLVHIPFLYLLVFSAIAHVIAVHMY